MLNLVNLQNLRSSFKLLLDFWKTGCGRCTVHTQCAYTILHTILIQYTVHRHNHVLADAWIGGTSCVQKLKPVCDESTSPQINALS